MTFEWPHEVHVEVEHRGASADPAFWTREAIGRATTKLLVASAVGVSPTVRTLAADEAIVVTVRDWVVTARVLTVKVEP